MPIDETFADFLRRIRAGDGEAAAELVRRYEPLIRMEVRVRLTDPRLKRLFDSMDICQSVLASFFVRAASGSYDLDHPEQLLRLLMAIARNKVAFHARRQHATRRDQRREVALNPVGQDVPAADPNPSRVAAGRELLNEVHRRLSAEERHLADLREQGFDWAAVADRVGGTPQALRKQLSRAVGRVARELGLDEPDGG
jgi:RNA polymerase sigma-70 factor (ECF subfamily)